MLAWYPKRYYLCKVKETNKVSPVCQNQTIKTIVIDGEDGKYKKLV
jgi:hypothetical protein